MPHLIAVLPPAAIPIPPLQGPSCLAKITVRVAVAAVSGFAIYDNRYPMVSAAIGAVVSLPSIGLIAAGYSGLIATKSFFKVYANSGENSTSDYMAQAVVLSVCTAVITHVSCTTQSLFGLADRYGY